MERKFYCTACGAEHSTDVTKIPCKVKVECNCGATVVANFTKRYIEVAASGIKDED